MVNETPIIDPDYSSNPNYLIERTLWEHLAGRALLAGDGVGHRAQLADVAAARAGALEVPVLLDLE